MSISSAPDISQNIPPVADESVYRQVAGAFTVAIEEVNDAMERHEDTIIDLMRVHDFLLQAKNFVIACSVATGSVNMATAAKKIMQNIPMALTNQGMAKVISPTDLGTASVYVVLAAATLINSLMEMNRVIGISRNLDLWLENKLDEYGHHVQAVAAAEKNLEAIHAKIGPLTASNVTRLVDQMVSLTSAEAFEEKQPDRLRSADAYSDQIRRLVKKGEHERIADLAASIKALPWAQREYFYLLLKQRQMEKLIDEHQTDIRTRLAFGMNSDNHEKCKAVIERYPLAVLGERHGAFHGNLVQLAQDDVARESLKIEAVVQERDKKLQEASQAVAAKAKKKVGISALNLVGALCMLAALLTGPAFPAVAIGLFIASTVVNVIMLRYYNDFPGIGETFSAAKKRFTTGRMRALLFPSPTREEKENQEILKLKETIINKSKAVLEQQSALHENAPGGMGQLLAQGVYQTYRTALTLLEKFYEDVTSGRLSIKEKGIITERILEVIREVLKVSADTGSDIIKQLSGLYAVVPAAAPLNLVGLQTVIQQTQIPSSRV